ncbi:MAG: dethiobiotin synthase [Polyangiaceae bacterium]
MGALVLVCGTGTEIGKTHFATALLRRAGRDGTTLGYKPVESGCAEWSGESDHAALAGASTFHVKHLPEYCLVEPISPHLAARREGRMIDVAALVDRIRALAEAPDFLLVELAGGLFSPLHETTLNADLVRLTQTTMPNTQTVLVAPDRLGVLHDLGATTRAAQASGVSLDGIVLSAPKTADSSTGANAAEIRCVTSTPLFGSLPRAPLEELVAHPELERIYSLLLRNFRRPASTT